MEIVTWLSAHWDDIAAVITAAVTLASLIVKLTPTLADDSQMLVIVKFLGKYIALNRTVDDEAVRKGE